MAQRNARSSTPTVSSTFQCALGRSRTNPFSAASGTNHGSRNVARNSSTCRKQSRPNASAYASDASAGLCAADKRHPREVAQSVVIIGSPRRCTMTSGLSRTACRRNACLINGSTACAPYGAAASAPDNRRSRSASSTTSACAGNIVPMRNSCTSGLGSSQASATTITW